MIQFALLFGLGFLTAVLITLMATPAIYRRVVAYTENRIKAILPISPQEVRAQKDMARAVYAAENARTGQELIETRERLTNLQLTHDSQLHELKQVEAENTDLKMTIDTLDIEAADARSRARQEDGYIQELKAALAESEARTGEREEETESLRQKLLRSSSDADNFRLDLSTRDTEVDGLKVRLASLRDERDNLRQELRTQTTRSGETERRLVLESERSARNEEKLAQEASARADREEALERRQQEIAQLREKLTATGTAKTALRRTAVAAPTTRPAERPGEKDIVSDPRITELAEEARNRATAFAERLTSGSASDDALREEMASIAAGMVAMTALSEGTSSPIRTVLSGKSANGKRESLATKAKKVMAPPQPGTTDGQSSSGKPSA